MLLQLCVGSVFIAEIRFNLFAVGVVVRERGVHLGHREVTEVLGDFLRAETTGARSSVTDRTARR
jgi:hypothetical protein